MLSPDVKEFLRKNKIKIRKGKKSSNGDDLREKSERSSKRSSASKLNTHHNFI